ncbi:XRE family transcriptional regulator [Arhodomonas aquaeolei]|uniref:XRE family transcriptional regulator n=1 Tax=Arhodomonas aquaeolei TaxID=2369 RepID=UPI0021672F54|nr:XRE family transcriptional regulator [Arhodomonas aquaeolei]MCS4502904.1 XRE family transcriptional regulator [Arhodomonas aquaeolei]
MAQAHITPQMLGWARERAGLSVSALARKLHVKDDKVEAWEEGDRRPTFRQAQNLARHTHVPFGYLFLREPPQEELPIPDLRTVGDHKPQGISADLRDTLREVIQRQLWYREYQQDRDADPVAVVASMGSGAAVDEVVRDMRDHLGVPAHPERGTWEEYFRSLVERIESLGIMVMRNSMVGTNTSRPLDVGEFRGFAIADRYAPVIFINTADCEEARLFTLIHELAHIWLGESGISDGEPATPHRAEKLCNAVAAEFLVPEVEFRPLWEPDQEWRQNLPALAARFHVSQWVIARRARELNLISEDEYRAYVQQKLAERRDGNRQGQPSFHRLQRARISTRFAQAVASEALSGRLLLRDAHRLTGIRPHKLADFARRELGL